MNVWRLRTHKLEVHRLEQLRLEVRSARKNSTAFPQDHRRFQVQPQSHAVATDPSMTARRYTILIALLLVGAIASTLACSCSARTSRPGVQPQNLLLITVEGVRADHISALGYRLPTTGSVRADGGPTYDLDWLAESGVNFSGALAASGDARTSLGTILTGASPLTHGLVTEGRALPADLPTLGADFEAAGFRTAAFVSASRSPLTGTGLERGFETYREFSGDLEALQALALDARSAAQDGRPGFCWLHLSGPMHPWSPSSIANAPDFRAPFLADQELGRVREDDEFFAALRSGSLEPTQAERRALIALYDSELLRLNFLVQSAIEAFVGAGGEPNLLERSAVLLVGTNGVELGERDGAWLADGGLHQESLHVPLILRHQASFTGRRILGGTVEHADIAPTLRELFGVRALGAGERSLLALTDSYVSREFPARPALALRGDPDGGLSVSVQVGNDRLVLAYRQQPQVFGLAADPSQRHDLTIALEERTQVVCRSAFDALRALATHPDLEGDGREYLLRTLHKSAGAPEVASGERGNASKDSKTH